MNKCRPFLFVLVTILLALATNAHSQTNLEWAAPIDLSAIGGDASEVDVAFSRDGSKATAVWSRFDGGNYVIQSASATIVGGTATWGTVSTLSTTGHSASNAHVAVSQDGTDAVAVWGYADTTTIIQAAVASISGNIASWSSATTISNAAQDAIQSRVTLSNNGQNGTAVWSRSNGSNYIIQSRSVVNHGTITWGNISNLSVAGQDALEPQIALSEDGASATAIWRRNDGSNPIIQSASGTISGSTATWGSASDLSASGRNAVSPQVAVSEDGTVAVAGWLRNNGSDFIVQSATAAISGSSATWGSATDLSATGGGAQEPGIAISDDGTKAIASWYRFNGSFNAVQSASATIASNTATWATPIDVSPVDRFTFYPRCAMSEDGAHAAVVWSADDGSNRIVQISEASITGNSANWGAVTDLSVAGENALFPEVRLSTDGSRGIVTWHRSNGSNTIVQSSSGAPATPTPIPTATATPVHSLQITGTPKAQGTGIALLKTPKINMTTSNSDGSLTIKGCAKYPAIISGSVYEVARKTDTPKQTLANKKIKKTNRCVTFTATVAGKYQLYLAWKRTKQPTKTSKKLTFDIN